jgi:hypothetical protein
MNGPAALLVLVAHLALLSAISFGGFPTVLPDVRQLVVDSSRRPVGVKLLTGIVTVLQLEVPIVSEPVIPPPPAAYALLRAENVEGGQPTAVATARFAWNAGDAHRARRCGRSDDAQRPPPRCFPMGRHHPPGLGHPTRYPENPRHRRDAFPRLCLS